MYLLTNYRVDTQPHLAFSKANIELIPRTESNCVKLCKMTAWSRLENRKVVSVACSERFNPKTKLLFIW